MWKLAGEVVQVSMSVGEDRFGNLFYNINQNPDVLRRKKAAQT